MSPLLLALFGGVLLANTPIGPHRWLAHLSAHTRFFLRCGVVALGLKLPAADIAALGFGAIVVIISTVAITYCCTLMVGDRMGLDRGYVTLLAAGFSICGAAAIAAIEDTVRAKERYLALAVAMVTIFGTAMIVIIPCLSGLFELSPRQSAIWAGASIHEVAQVVAAASIIGPGAVTLATTIKLGRVALLAPMHAAAARRNELASHGAGRVIPPWFVIGFAIAIAVRATDLLTADILSAANDATTILLAIGMFGLGMGIRAKDLWPIEPRALALAAISTTIAASSALALTLLLT